MAKKHDPVATTAVLLTIAAIVGLGLLFLAAAKSGPLQAGTNPNTVGQAFLPPVTSLSNGTNSTSGATCYDSDELQRNAFMIPGYVSATEGDLKIYQRDFCKSDASVVEYQCDRNNKTMSIVHNCPSRMHCESGACVPKPLPQVEENSNGFLTLN